VDDNCVAEKGVVPKVWRTGKIAKTTEEMSYDWSRDIDCDFSAIGASANDTRPLYEIGPP